MKKVLKDLLDKDQIPFKKETDSTLAKNMLKIWLLIDDIPDDKSELLMKIQKLAFYTDGFNSNFNLESLLTDQDISIGKIISLFPEGDLVQFVKENGDDFLAKNGRETSLLSFDPVQWIVEAMFEDRGDCPDGPLSMVSSKVAYKLNDKETYAKKRMEVSNFPNEQIDNSLPLATAVLLLRDMVDDRLEKYKGEYQKLLDIITNMHPGSSASIDHWI